MQTTEGNCGQACISMLTGVDIEEVKNAYKWWHIHRIIIDALDTFGIRHAKKNKRISKKNSIIPEIAILTVHFAAYTHWVLFYKGLYLDPEYGIMEQYTKGKITSFLECFEC